MLFLTEFQTVLTVTFEPGVKYIRTYRVREPLLLCNMFWPIAAIDNR